MAADFCIKFDPIGFAREKCARIFMRKINLNSINWVECWLNYVFFDLIHSKWANFILKKELFKDDSLHFLPKDVASFVLFTF